MRHLKKTYSRPCTDYSRFSGKYFPSRVTTDSGITETTKIVEPSSTSSISQAASASVPSSKLSSSDAIKEKKTANNKLIKEQLSDQTSCTQRFAAGRCHVHVKSLRRIKQLYISKHLQKLQKTLKDTSSSSKGTPSTSNNTLERDRGESSRSSKEKLVSFEGRGDQLQKDTLESEKADNVVGEWSLSRFLAEIYPGKYPPWIRPTSNDATKEANSDSEMTYPTEVKNIPRVGETAIDHTPRKE